MLIRGDEQLLVDRAVSGVVADARRVDPETQRAEADAAVLGVGDLSDMLAPSLFAEPRVVVIRQAHQARKELADAIAAYAADPAPYVTLVVQHGGGARNRALLDRLTSYGAAVITCTALKRADQRIDFLRGEVAAAGGRATPAALATLVDAVGNDLAELASAVSQLMSDTGGAIDEDAVRRYHHGRAGVSGYTVADHAVVGRIPEALEALRWGLAIGVPQVVIADALADGVRTIGRVASAGGGSAAVLAGRLGMPAWKVDRARGQARHWTAESLAGAVARVTELNAAVKGYAADADYALEAAVIAIGRAARTR